MVSHRDVEFFSVELGQVRKGTAGRRSVAALPAWTWTCWTGLDYLDPMAVSRLSILASPSPLASCSPHDSLASDHL